MMKNGERLVVVGADAAGMSAAHQALRGAKKQGHEIEVVVLEMTQHTSYSACGIPYWVAGDVDAWEELSARTADQHRDMGVDMRMGCTATDLDLEARKVGYTDPSGARAEIAYDQLVLATGASPILPDWAKEADGSLIPGVHPLKTLTDGEVWLDLLGITAPDPDAGLAKPRRGVVIGGGYIGVEMAEALVRRGWEATLVTRSRVMSSLDPDMSARIETGMEAAGVEIVPDATVSGLERGPDGTVRAVETSDGKSYPADVVVVAMGVTPATEIGAAAGLPIGAHGGYLADPSGRLADRVWAAGDCCEARHRLTGEWVFVPLGTHANKQGKTIGINLAGGSATFDGVLGTAITRFVHGDQHIEISRVGLSEKEAARAGIELEVLVTEGRTASGYMPEASKMATKVLAEVGTRRLMGLQIVGGHGAGKRIDTAAAAMWGGLTVDDLAGMDLSYAPPFATVWEAVQLAARRLADRM